MESGKEEAKSEIGQEDSESESDKEEAKSEIGKEDPKSEIAKEDAESESDKDGSQSESGKEEAKSERGDAESESDKDGSQSESDKEEAKSETGKEDPKSEIGNEDAESESESGKEDAESQSGNEEGENGAMVAPDLGRRGSEDAEMVDAGLSGGEAAESETEEDNLGDQTDSSEDPEVESNNEKTAAKIDGTRSESGSSTSEESEDAPPPEEEPVQEPGLQEPALKKLRSNTTMEQQPAGRASAAALGFSTAGLSDPEIQLKSVTLPKTPLEEKSKQYTRADKAEKEAVVELNEGSDVSVSISPLTPLSGLTSSSTSSRSSSSSSSSSSSGTASTHANEEKAGEQMIAVRNEYGKTDIRRWTSGPQFDPPPNLPTEEELRNNFLLHQPKQTEIGQWFNNEAHAEEPAKKAPSSAKPEGAELPSPKHRRRVKSFSFSATIRLIEFVQLLFI